MQQQVVIVGGGNQARTAFVYFSEDSAYEVVAFAVHAQYHGDKKMLGLDVVPFEDVEDVFPPDRVAMFVALGYSRVNQIRAQVVADCRKKGYELISYVSSRANRWGEMAIGENCFILEGCTFQPFTRIGDNVVISMGCMIGHDVVIGEHCFIGPGVVIAGGVTIGPFCFIGANATLRNGITIGRGCVIGAGAILLKDTGEQEVYLAKGTEPFRLKADALEAYIGASRVRNGNGLRS